MARGFKKISQKMANADDEILRKAEESIKRLEGEGFGKEESKPAPKPTPRYKPTMEDMEESTPEGRFRKKFRGIFGR